MLNLDEEFKGYDTSSLKKISLSIGLKKHPKNRGKTYISNEGKNNEKRLEKH